jgi:hypothetical protein
MHAGSRHLSVVRMGRNRAGWHLLPNLRDPFPRASQMTACRDCMRRSRRLVAWPSGWTSIEPNLTGFLRLLIVNLWGPGCTNCGSPFCKRCRACRDAGLTIVLRHRVLHRGLRVFY